MSFTAIQSDIADVIAEFGSSGYILRKVQSSTFVAGKPSVTTTTEAVKYIIDSNRKYMDPQSAQHPHDLWVLIPGDVSFEPTTDDIFQTRNGNRWVIERCDPIEVQDVMLAYTLHLAGTQ